MSKSRAKKRVLITGTGGAGIIAASLLKSPEIEQIHQPYRVARTPVKMFAEIAPIDFSPRPATSRRILKMKEENQKIDAEIAALEAIKTKNISKISLLVDVELENAEEQFGIKRDHAKNIKFNEDFTIFSVPQPPKKVE